MAVHSSTLNAASFFETSVMLYQITMCLIPKGSILFCSITSYNSLYLVIPYRGTLTIGHEVTQQKKKKTFYLVARKVISDPYYYGTQTTIHAINSLLNVASASDITKPYTPKAHLNNLPIRISVSSSGLQSNVCTQFLFFYYALHVPSIQQNHFNIYVHIKQKTKLRGLSPRENYTDRTTATCRQS
jgi:hypothetical protein